MKIYVIRHGQTEWNVKNVYQGHKDIPLNDVGKIQAEQLAEKFKDINIDTILVSPLTRAKETAQYVSRVAKVPITIENGLIERNFGDMEGKSNREDCNLNMLLDYNKNYKICNVEPIQSLFKRVHNCLDNIIEKYKGNNIAIVTHGGVAEAIECYFHGMPANKNIQSLSMKNGQIREYDTIEREEQKRKSYITVLSSENYLLGVLALYESLKNVGSIYSLNVVITNDISEKSEKVLEQHGISTIRINSIQIPNSIREKNDSGLFSHWTNTFDKLQIFELTQFDKLVYLDSDMYVRNNIDELFEKKHFSATIDRRIGPIITNDWINLTSGLMVIEPKKGMMNEFLNILSGIENKRESIGDQDVLQEYDREWNKKEELHLDITYNMYFPHLDYYTHYGDYKLEDISVIHFILKDKPFQFKKEYIEEYLRKLDSMVEEKYKKSNMELFKNQLQSGNEDRKQILKEYFDLLEKVKLKYKVDEAEFEI